MSLSLDPEGRTLVSIDRAYTVSVWDMATGDFVFTLGPNPHSQVEVRFSPDGSTLATRVDGFSSRAVIYSFGQTAP